MVKVRKWVKGHWKGKGKNKVWITGHYTTVDISWSTYINRQKRAVRQIFG